MTEINPLTGLPTLPKGYYFRVGRRDWDGDIKMSIRKRVWYVFFTEVEYTYIRGSVNESIILDSAEYLVRRAAQYGNLHPGPVLRDNRFAGSYPPKKLGK